MGANIEAAAEAKRFGISTNRAVKYKCDSAGTALNYEAINQVVCSIRQGKKIDDDWSEIIKRDYKKRGK